MPNENGAIYMNGRHVGTITSERRHRQHAQRDVRGQPAQSGAGSGNSVLPHNSILHPSVLTSSRGEVISPHLPARDWPEYMSKRDINEGKGVDPGLLQTIKQGQRDAPWDKFTIAPQGGTRTQAQQDALVAKGVSRTRDSNHLGGRAVDIVPLTKDGKYDWDSKEAQGVYGRAEKAIMGAQEKSGTTIGPEHNQIKSWDPGHYSIAPGPSAPASTAPTMSGFGGGDQTSTTMPLHARAFVQGIGRSETDFDPKEAYSERYNKTTGPNANANVKKYGQAGADYGYYQMNQMDVDQAVNKYGMDQNVAKHLAGGGGPESSSVEQQTQAVHDYIKKRWPTQYDNLVNKGDYEGMRNATKGTWFGLKDHPEKARGEYDRTLNGGDAPASPAPGKQSFADQAPFRVAGREMPPKPESEGSEVPSNLYEKASPAEPRGRSSPQEQKIYTPKTKPRPETPLEDYEDRSMDVADNSKNLPRRILDKIFEPEQVVRQKDRHERRRKGLHDDTNIPSGKRG